ncbi:MAG: hypothetical protein ACP5VE_08165 [Chthonomonadales bacterium]
MVRFVARLAVAAALVVPVAARAQTPSPQGNVQLARLVSGSYAMGGARRSAESPFSNASLRGGAMLSPRGAALVGLDLSIPSLTTTNNWHARLDGDVIIKANFGGIDTIVPVTVDLLTYTGGGMGLRDVYFGGGVGAVLGGPAKFDGKLILGTDLSNRLGAELNVHFTERDTLVTLLARFHM